MSWSYKNKVSLGLLIALITVLGACDLPQKGTVKRWQQLGSSLRINANRDAINSDLALDSAGNPVVSWSERCNNDSCETFSFNLYVKRWDGNQWIQLGERLNDNTFSGYNSKLALDSAGHPVVVWAEGGDIFVKRWDGNSWVPFSEIPLVNPEYDALSPKLSLDKADRPVVVWSEITCSGEFCRPAPLYVKRWNGNKWIQLGESLYVNSDYSAIEYSLALDNLGNPTVGWIECHNVPYNCDDPTIYIKRWDDSKWVQLGKLVQKTSIDFSSPNLAIDNSGNPVISFTGLEGVDYANSRLTIFVKRWNGSSWIQLGTVRVDKLNSYASNPSLALDSSGNPVVSWHEIDNTVSPHVGDIYVKHWNGKNWVQLGGILDVDPKQSATFPSLALDSSNNPVISWEEFDGTASQIYVKRLVDEKR